MDWRDEYEAAVIERNGLIMALTAAEARAEAAENDSRAWEALAARAEAIVMVQQDKIAELEAQLAAQAWRPVTEKPTEAGYYQAVNDGLYEHCYYGPNGWEDYYLTPTHWRPLTDPPLTGES